MSIRHRTIIESVLGHSEGITGKQLSGQLRVSGKTVRNDIAAVNQWLKEEGLSIRSSQRQGYYIEEASRSQMLALLKSQEYPQKGRGAQTPIERRLAILDRVLGHPGSPIERIAEFLWVSEQSIYKDIACLDQELKENCGFSGLWVHNHKVYLKAGEAEIRRLVLRIIHSCILRGGQLMDRWLCQLMGSIINLDEIYTFYDQVRDYCVRNHIRVPQQVLYMAAWAVFYVNVRREEAHFLEKGACFNRKDRLAGFLRFMNQTFFLEFEDQDLEFLYRALRAVGFLPEEEQKEICVEEMSQARELWNRFRGELEKQYHLTFLCEDQEQQAYFFRELKCLLCRVREGYQLCGWPFCHNEPGEILYREAAVMMSRLVRDQTGMFLTAEEVERMAWRVQACAGRRERSVKMVMVCEEDVGQYYRIRRWLEERLGDQVKVRGFCPGYLLEEECLAARPDLAVSVKPKDLGLPLPLVILEDPPGAEEERKVREILWDRIQKHRVRSFLDQLIGEQGVMVCGAGISLEDMTRRCAESLKERGCIRDADDFLGEIRERARAYPWKAEGGCHILLPFGRHGIKDGIAVAVERCQEGNGKVVFAASCSCDLEKSGDRDETWRILDSFFRSRDMAGKLGGIRDKKGLLKLVSESLETKIQDRR